MDLLQLKDLLSNSGWGLIILLTLIQIAPIKINPWGALLKFLGKAINAELNEKMDGFKGDLQGIKKDVATLQTDVTSLKDDVTTLKSDVVTMKNDINGVGGKVDKLRYTVDENEAKQARVRILRFSDEILNNIPHGDEHYAEILRCCDSYEEYCMAHPTFKNSVAVNSIDEIKKSYEEHRQKRSFLEQNSLNNQKEN